MCLMGYFLKSRITVGISYCVSGIQQSDTCICIYVCVYLFFFRFFSLIGYYKALSIVPCVIQ